MRKLTIELVTFQNKIHKTCLHVTMIPQHHDMVRLHVGGAGDGLQIRKIASNLFNNTHLKLVTGCMVQTTTLQNVTRGADLKSPFRKYRLAQKTPDTAFLLVNSEGLVDFVPPYIVYILRTLLDWIDMAQDRDRWRALVIAVMNLRVSESFLTS
jgi:hypothetical protein